IHVVIHVVAAERVRVLDRLAAVLMGDARGILTAVVVDAVGEVVAVVVDTVGAVHLSYGPAARGPRTTADADSAASPILGARAGTRSAGALIVFAWLGIILTSDDNERNGERSQSGAREQTQ